MEPPADIDPRDLAPEIRSQLRTLSKDAADRVAKHLVAAGRLVDEDPQAALEQARAARALGARVAVVREAVGETAYAAGEWAEAIAELRTARRMTGDDSGLPMLADAERALGRADRALRLAQSPEAAALEPAARAEMVMVEAGARHDLGQLDAALVTLQDFGLDRAAVRPWSARVWYAYADLLLAAGRADEAREWFAAAVDIDRDGTTDAEERLLELDGIVVVDEDDVDEDAGVGSRSDDPADADADADDPAGAGGSVEDGEGVELIEGDDPAGGDGVIEGSDSIEGGDSVEDGEGAELIDGDDPAGDNSAGGDGVAEGDGVAGGDDPVDVGDPVDGEELIEDDDPAGGDDSADAEDSADADDPAGDDPVDGGEVEGGEAVEGEDPVAGEGGGPGEEDAGPLGKGGTAVSFSDSARE